METKMTKEQFVSKIKSLHYVESITGKTYSYLTVSGNYCSGIRESTGKIFKIDLDDLYAAYVNIDKADLNTANLKKYIDRRQSPGLAILKAIQ